MAPSEANAVPKEVGPIVLDIPPADAGSIVGSVDDAWWILPDIEQAIAR